MCGTIKMVIKMKTDDFDLEMLDRARTLAYRGHKGQTRKNGDAFITHPERIVKAISNYTRGEFGPEKDYYKNYNIAIMLGWLHDLVEDTDVQLKGIETLFGTEISTRLEVLTRKKGESYFDYGNRVYNSKDRLVYLVKLTDLNDNLNSVGDGAFPKETEDALRIRWEWLRMKLIEKYASLR